MGKRIISRRRGRGGKYSVPSHRYKCEIRYPRETRGLGTIMDIEHDPGHTAPVAKVKLENGDSPFYMLAFEGMQVGGKIRMDINPPVKPGNIMPLGNIPEGTQVHCLESQPGDGGKYVRSSGTAATVVSHGTTTVVRLPSGAFKTLSNQCRATIGKTAGGGRKIKPIMKAGKHFHFNRSRKTVFPRVSGIAMNPVDHPHGGGGHQHIGRPSTVSRRAPPGTQVGHVAAKRTGRRR